MKKSIIIAVLLLFCFVAVCHSAQIVCIGLETQREGICDIWDIIEMHEDDVYLGGQGYALFEIIQIPGMPKQDVINTMNFNKVDTQLVCDPNMQCKSYWYYDAENPALKDWYEIKIQPKYMYTVEDFTQEDIVILFDDLATTQEKYTVLQKTKDKITLYPQNYETVIPKK